MQFKNMQINTNEGKIAVLEKMVSDTQLELKNKFSATSWMNNLGGGNNSMNSEMLKMAVDREEEN